MLAEQISKQTKSSYPSDVVKIKEKKVKFVTEFGFTPSHHELSPLERAIQNFEKKAFLCHDKALNIPANETAQERLKREQELKSAFAHLKNEGLHIKTLAQIQQRLEEYRKKAEAMTRKEFRDKIIKWY